jgi:hypothetical protein
MNQLSRISPVSDAEAARLVQPGTMADLASEITASSVPPAQGRSAQGHHGHAAPSTGHSRRRRGWVIGAPLAAGLAATVFIIANASSPGHQPGSAGRNRPVTKDRPVTKQRGHTTQAQVLSFIRHGGYIVVKVRDPLADPARYNAEFARHHLHIRLTMVPVSPSLVGTLVYMGSSQGASPITPITARGRCFTGGGGSACPVGVRVPVAFHGNAQLTFGRAARPGEQYESTASAFAPGEALHGMSIKGETVAQVLVALRARHVRVALYDAFRHNLAVHLHHVPGSYYVYDAVPWAQGQVMLFVGRGKIEPGAPVGNGPQPSPSPAS